MRTIHQWGVRYMDGSHLVVHDAGLADGAGAVAVGPRENAGAAEDVLRGEIEFGTCSSF